jgi:TPR repeat protein
MIGNGILQDYHEASLWFRKAIAAGDTNAHWLLGKLLLENKGML